MDVGVFSQEGFFGDCTETFLVGEDADSHARRLLAVDEFWTGLVTSKKEAEAKYALMEVLGNQKKEDDNAGMVAFTLCLSFFWVNARALSEAHISLPLSTAQVSPP